MKIPLLTIGLLAFACGVEAQNITKVTTLFCSSLQTNGTGQMFHAGKTNSITLVAGEAARVSSQKFWTAGDESNFAYTGFVQHGVWFDLEDGDVVEGPVTFVIEMTATTETFCRLTLERFKVAKK